MLWKGRVTIALIFLPYLLPLLQVEVRPYDLQCSMLEWGEVELMGKSMSWHSCSWLSLGAGEIRGSPLFKCNLFLEGRDYVVVMEFYCNTWEFFNLSWGLWAYVWLDNN